MNSAQFDLHTPNKNPNHNSLCGRRIQVNGPRGSAEVRIVDRCPGCPYGGLDLSPAAFQTVAGNLDKSARGGHVECELDAKNQRVLLRGHAVTVMQGQLQISRDSLLKK
ncbi:unnamed protein product [Adineta steineri]|uniref:RlpA-like protein double-psi beta-barrel domain-containing protein n=1 Tax=Adineta steineri TaxID=433720 RepID=A0A815I7I5_9BILA|nr:unnamed protein product [Adineta steineri]